MNIGKTAPDFSLKDGDGNDWNLAQQRGTTVVLLFYPGDNTPICTAQMCSVRDNWSQYQETGAEVVGISTDSVKSHKSFTDKYSLTLRLLSDEAGEVIESYNVKSWLPGRSARAVVVIDKNGIIRYYKVQSLSLFRPDDSEILDAIEEANN